MFAGIVHDPEVACEILMWRHVPGPKRIEGIANSILPDKNRINMQITGINFIMYSQRTSTTQNCKSNWFISYCNKI